MRAELSRFKRRVWLQATQWIVALKEASHHTKVSDETPGLTHRHVKEFSDRFRSGWVIACMLVWFWSHRLTSFSWPAPNRASGVQGYERIRHQSAEPGAKPLLDCSWDT